MSGWAIDGVADRVGVALGAVGARGRRRPPRSSAASCSASAGSASQGARNPGVCEPCPGQTTTITTPVCQPRGSAGCARRYKLFAEALCATAQEAPISSGGRRRGCVLVVAHRPDDERRLQDQRLARAGGIPADHVGDALEAVAHGVRVHEQLACGRLERATVVEVAPQRRRAVRSSAPAAAGRCGARASRARAGRRRGRARAAGRRRAPAAVRGATTSRPRSPRGPPSRSSTRRRGSAPRGRAPGGRGRSAARAASRSP